MSRRGKKLVLLGMMTKIPVPGVVWQTVHYLIGLQRLGFDPYYVEAHARTPSMLMERREDDSSARAATFIDGVMRHFDLGGRWALHALHDDGGHYGMTSRELGRLYSSAEVIINLHGGTMPRPEHAETGRLVYVETDPVQLQLELHAELPETLAFLEPHVAFFTFGENWGTPDCGLPPSDRFVFHPTRQPVVIDFWASDDDGPGRAFTTVGNWVQHWREVTHRGEVLSWSKHREFQKFLELPSRTDQELELTLAQCGESDRRRLEAFGFTVRDALEFSTDVDAYRSYIQGSRGEFTVAKEQNVRLRTGWFSDRSATYLAAGRPVITQDTGFGTVLPTGEGLVPFSNLEEAVEAISTVNADIPRHRAGALAIAREHFDARTVLTGLLDQVGVELAGTRGRPRRSFDPGLVLEPLSRRPTRLAPATAEAVLLAPIPHARPRGRGGPDATIVVVTYDNLAFSRLCLESVVASTDSPAYELLVVDNGSTDGTIDYVGRLTEIHSHVRLIESGANPGFPAAANTGLDAAAGELLVLLNNDTIVPPCWLTRMARHAADPSVGTVGPVTNRIGTEAEIPHQYRTYGGFLEHARARARDHDGELFDIRMPAMFCLAMRRAVYERVGRIDERFEIGMLEDDDYALRVRAAGYRTVCAEDVLVHHFGEASFGKLVPTGSYGRLLEANQARFEEKWGRPWEPYPRRENEEYEYVIETLREVVRATVPSGSTVLVASRGDDLLLQLNGRRAWHFPQTDEGVWAGHYPADDSEAVTQLERLRGRGAQFLVFPKTGFWWLEHYEGLRDHLETRHRTVVRREDACVIYALDGESA